MLNDSFYFTFDTRDVLLFKYLHSLPLLTGKVNRIVNNMNEYQNESDWEQINKKLHLEVVI